MSHGPTLPARNARGRNWQPQYGMTVTYTALPPCGAARNSASTKASSSVLVFGDLSIIVSFLARGVRALWVDDEAPRPLPASYADELAGS
jgi:hypothetical protein